MHERLETSIIIPSQGQPAQSQLARLSFLLLWLSAWLVSLYQPGTVLGAGAAYLGALVFCRVTEAHSTSARYREWYLLGLFLNLGALPWMPEAIQNYYAFMGVSKTAACVAYVLCAAYLALQFPFALWCVKSIPTGRWDKFALRAPLAWLVSEVLFYSPFPWFFGSAFLAVRPLAQVADLIGVPFVSFVAIWLAALVTIPSAAMRFPRRALSVTLIVLCLVSYERFRATEIQRAVSEAPTISVALVQGNDPLLNAPSQELITEKMIRYLEISSEIFPQPDLLIWPEVANLHLIKGDSTSYSPSFDTTAKPVRRPLLFAGHTSKELPDRKELFYQVSAMVLQPDGTLSSGYHKRRTFPLAEDIPFKETFPFLTHIFGKRFFVPGEEGKPIQIPLPRGRGASTPPPLSAATLICYEDLVPGLFQTMVRDSHAQVLFSLSNGQWFGKSIAVQQHALLASWRAVENGRFLVRAATTGLTRLVDPQGRILDQLEPFKEGVLRIPKLPLLNASTIFTTLGVAPLRIASVCIFLAALMCYLWNTFKSRIE